LGRRLRRSGLQPRPGRRWRAAALRARRRAGRPRPACPRRPRPRHRPRPGRHRPRRRRRRDARGGREPDRPHNRFNDCRVDPAGRFFCGTKTNVDDGGRGALHRIDADLRASVAIADTELANGIGWSPDGTTLYFIDSPLQRLDAYEFDPATGDVGGRRTVAAIDPDDGLPDGLAVDAEGGVWVALVNGGMVRRYEPDGRTSAEVRLPVDNPTCPGFGAPDLRTLYVTTAHLRSDPRYADDNPLAGALFALDVGVPGVPSPPFAG
jgi:sugar lactone lactonase YvrE